MSTDTMHARNLAWFDDLEASPALQAEVARFGSGTFTRADYLELYVAGEDEDNAVHPESKPLDFTRAECEAEWRAEFEYRQAHPEAVTAELRRRAERYKIEHLTYCAAHGFNPATPIPITLWADAVIEAQTDAEILTLPAYSDEHWEALYRPEPTDLFADERARWHSYTPTEKFLSLVRRGFPPEDLARATGMTYLLKKDAA